MKISDHISGKPNGPSQRLIRKPRARVALTTGLAMIALAGSSAAAQAATTPFAAAHIAAARTVASVKLGRAAIQPVTCNGPEPILDYHHGTPLWSYVPGNGNVNLYFDNSGASTAFCPILIAQGGNVTDYQFYAAGTNVCLALNSSAKSIWEGSATACEGLAPYTIWEDDTVNSSWGLFRSYHTSVCMYDDTQRPATYSTCNASDQFEWMSLP